MAKTSSPDHARGARATQKRVSQADVPARTLREALVIAQTLWDFFPKDGAPPQQIANALKMALSTKWDYLTGAAMAYGLTNARPNAAKIALTELGRRATAPTEEGDDIKARAEAALKPKVCREFFQALNGKKFPPDHIALNVLRENYGVPADRAETTLEILKDNGAFVGFIHNDKAGPLVSIDDLQPMPVAIRSESVDSATAEVGEIQTAVAESLGLPVPETAKPAVAPTAFKVFISHSKNMAVVNQVKDILALYDIDHELAIEEETAAIPVPQKILAAMRRCQAAVMVVTADEQSGTGAEFSINTNVLIEIGAAFVLYDQKVVLLWDKRLKVPSNIQGLYRCEFEGNELSFAVGTKLAKALKGFTRPLAS